MQIERTVAEFFAGIGLMRLGLERAGWRVVWANDIDEDKQAMYCGHFHDGADHSERGDVPCRLRTTVLLRQEFA